MNITNLKIRVVILSIVITIGLIISFMQKNKAKEIIKYVEVIGVIDSIKFVPSDKGSYHFYINNKWQDSVTTNTEGMSFATVGDSISKKKSSDLIELFRFRNGVYVRIYPN